MKYGQFIEFSEFQNACEKWKLLTENEFKKGDAPCDFGKVPGGYNFVLVVNSDNFLDCEYLLGFNGTIYTREEFKEIIKKLNKEGIA